jgi:hypothetical protein
MSSTAADRAPFPGLGDYAATRKELGDYAATRKETVRVRRVASRGAGVLTLTTSVPDLRSSSSTCSQRGADASAAAGG